MGLVNHSDTATKLSGLGGTKREQGATHRIQFGGSPRSRTSRSPALQGLKLTLTSMSASAGSPFTAKGL